MNKTQDPKLQIATDLERERERERERESCVFGHGFRERVGFSTKVEKERARFSI